MAYGAGPPTYRKLPHYRRAAAIAVEQRLLSEDGAARLRACAYGHPAMVAVSRPRILGEGSRPAHRGAFRGDTLHPGLVLYHLCRPLDRLYAGRMMQGFSDLVAFFEDSSLADAIRENDVLFPSIESVHVLAICLVVGSIMAVDLRLLGLAWVQRPGRAGPRGILPLTGGAFAFAVASRFLMFMSNATKYLGNGFFIAKLCLIAAAGLNMLVFHFIGARQQSRWDNQATPPLPARLAGGISVLLWIAVVACG